MRRIALIVTLLVGAGGLMHWASQSFLSSWEPRLRARLESSLGLALQARVEIDTLSLSFPHRVRLHHVRVWDATQQASASRGAEEGKPGPLIFRAANVTLTLSLFDLPRALVHRRPLEAIGLVAVKSPWLRLSRETISKRQPSKGSRASWPLWFTLAWEGGALQWTDPRVSRGAWTMYQAQGVFRVRGPQTTFALRGQTREAETCRFQFSTFGRRWNAQGYLVNGSIERTLLLARQLLEHAPAASGLILEGRYQLQIHAMGRRPPTFSERPWDFLQEARLTLNDAQGVLTPTLLPVVLSGTWVMKGDRISTSDFALRSRGKTLLVSGYMNPFGPRARLHLTGRGPQAELTLHMRRAQDRWEFMDDSFFRLFQGRVSMKGSVSAEGSDLQMALSDLPLTALSRVEGWPGPEGRLNVSCALRGPWGSWRAAGAWWLTGFQWGLAPPNDIRGDFEVTAQRFQAQAASEDSRFRFSAEGSRNERELRVDRFEARLPSGGALSGEGRIGNADQEIRGEIQAEKIAFPSDLPFIKSEGNPFRGTFQVKSQLRGTPRAPVLKGNLLSQDLQAGDQPLGKASASFSWEKTRSSLAASFTGPLAGNVSLRQDPELRGSGSLTLQNVAWEHWPLSKATLLFEVKSPGIEIKKWTLETPQAMAQIRGKAQWSIAEDSSRPSRVVFKGEGDIRSTEQGASLWKDPLEFTITWDQDHLAWANAHWGTRWSSKGTLTRDKEATAWSGRLEARDISSAELHRWLAPKAHDVLEGTLSGVLDLTGPVQHATVSVSATLENARFRAFRFRSDLQGQWGPEGWKPLSVTGTLKSGGQFQFNGNLSEANILQGSLKLGNFNVRPLGESLSFPKPLDGTVAATLTANGPLSSLRWSGHLEGGPIVYAAKGEHPLKFENLSMDMTVAPLPDQPEVMRLTVAEGQAKTLEEQVRINAGSFVEFAGNKPARLQIGTEIRNLHLGLFTLFGGMDVHGTWQIKPAGFAIQGDIRPRSLFINDYELEEGLVLADYYNGILKFQRPSHTPVLVSGTIDFRQAPQLKFSEFSISGKDQQTLQLSGDVGPALWDFRMAGRGLDMGTLAGLAGFPHPFSGSADLLVRGTGDPQHPHIEGKVTLEGGAVFGLAYRSGSAAFVWQDDRMTFTQLTLSDPGRYRLEGAGVLPLLPKDEKKRDRTLDFSIRLQDANLRLLQSFSNEVKEARGPVEGLLHIKGTVDDPAFRGSLRVTNGEVVGAHYFRHLRNFHLAIDFERDRMAIRELRGRSGDGEFRAGGSVSFAGFEPSQYDVRMEVISSKGVDVQVPELAIPESPLAKRFRFLTTASRCDVRGRVALRGPAEAPVFSGEGIFSNGHFTFPPSRKNPPPPALLAWLRKIFWDVSLKFQDGAWFENELVQANVAGALRLQGPSDRLKVDGGLDISDGKISYLGLQFDIRQARYDVRSSDTGSAVLNTPYVRGVAESKIQAVDTVGGPGATTGPRLNINDVITLTLDYAPVDQIKPRLTSASNPTLSQEKLLARVTQTDIENLTPQERTYLYQKQIVSLIDTSLATPLAQNILKKAGIADRLRVQHVIDPSAASPQEAAQGTPAAQQTGGVNLFANTKYTVEKDLSSRLSVGYGIRFIPSSAVDPDIQQKKLDLISDVQLSYRWFRNVYLRGAFDLPTSNPGLIPERKVTIEPRWRFGWWGHTNKPKPKPPPETPAP